MNVREKWDRLIDAYQAMSDFTRPHCGQCRVPHGCCEASSCLIASMHIKETFKYDTGLPRGLQVQGKHTFLEKDEKGNVSCALPPFLRPSCTAHHCDLSVGYSDKFDMETYFNLRDTISDLYFDLNPDEGF